MSSVNISVANVAEQAAQAIAMSAEQQAELLAEAKKELGLVGKWLRTGNRESIISLYVAGLHSLKFVNLCVKAGKARAFATSELERELSWWLGKGIDANMIIRTYVSINLLHGDLAPPPAKTKAAAWNKLVDSVPPAGHFQKAWNQFVVRQDGASGSPESWALLPGFEDRCRAMYKEVLEKGVALDDQIDNGKVIEKGLVTLSRELLVQYMRFRADEKAAEAAAKSDAKEELVGKAKELEDKATEQQKVVKGLLQQTQEAKPESKAKIEKEAKDAAATLEQYRKEMRETIDKAAAAAREAEKAKREAKESESEIARTNGKLEKKTAAVAATVPLTWQQQAQQAAAKAGPKDLAEALYGIVTKHAELEDVLYAMLTLHRKSMDCSKFFRASLEAFSATWVRKTAKDAA